MTAKGRHWAYPPATLEQLDAAGRVHWPRKEVGMPRLKQYPEDLPGVPLQDISSVRPLHNLTAERLGYPTQAAGAAGPDNQIIFKRGRSLRQSPLAQFEVGGVPRDFEGA